MTRVVVTASDERDRLVARLREIEDVVGVGVERGTSVEPPGDVITIYSTNDATREVLDALLEARDTVSSIVLSEPRTLLVLPSDPRIENETNETIWEEMTALLRRETNVNWNYIGLMATAGAIAVLGIWSDALHLVVGAMVVAPGFEPILRAGFGLATGPRRFAMRGGSSTAVGYAALIAAAALTTGVLGLANVAPDKPVASLPLAAYWSTLTPIGVGTAIAAAVGGAIAVIAQRSVLTAGAMIALALVPSSALVGMALADGDGGLVVRAAGRWAVDAVCVFVVGGAIVAVHRALIQRRHAES